MSQQKFKKLREINVVLGGSLVVLIVMFGAFSNAALKLIAENQQKLDATQTQEREASTEAYVNLKKLLETERTLRETEKKLALSEADSKKIFGDLYQARNDRDAYQKRFNGLWQPLFEKESALCSEKNGSLLSFGEIQNAKSLPRDWENLKPVITSTGDRDFTQFCVPFENNNN